MIKYEAIGGKHDGLLMALEELNRGSTELSYYRLTRPNSSSMQYEYLKSGRTYAIWEQHDPMESTPLTTLAKLQEYYSAIQHSVIECLRKLG